jgi:hypothetical protein
MRRYIEISSVAHRQSTCLMMHEGASSNPFRGVDLAKGGCSPLSNLFGNLAAVGVLLHLVRGEHPLNDGAV